MQSYSQSSMKTTFRLRGKRLYTRMVRQENVNVQSVRKKGCDALGGWRGGHIKVQSHPFTLGAQKSAFLR